MTNLYSAIQNVLNENKTLPFAVYCSIKEQKLLNVPIAKPLLIIVIKGDKKLMLNDEITCHAGDFIFLSNSSSINMRNIPNNKEYFSLLIEFDYQDFKGLEVNTSHKKNYVIAKTTPILAQCLQQFVESSVWAPKDVWALRKREVLSLLCHLGHKDILPLLGKAQIKDKLHDMFIAQGGNKLTTEKICDNLAMSESTLRRKLKLEGTSVQEVKNQTRLGLALHLLQTTQLSIGVVADKSGYQSQSRFTERFKKRFGLTPSELRKTKMTD